MKGFFKELARGRLFRHPIHPMLVHFPTALFSSSLLLDLMGWFNGDRSFAAASFYCLCIGIAMGLVAVLFGVIDYLKLTGNERLFIKASRHAVIQILVMILFGTLTAFRWLEYPELSTASLAETVLSACGVLLMITGNYIGGDLVFSDRVGIEKQHDKD